MIDPDMQKLIDEADTMVLNDTVYMDASIIEDLARTIAAQHHFLVSTGSVDANNERLQGQASVAIILLNICKAIGAKHSEEIAAASADGVDFERELGDLTQPPE